MARTRRQQLSTPRTGLSLGIHYDTDRFGQFSEAIARFLGTAKYLVAQTIVVIVWILLNVLATRYHSGYHWDKYPFILLNLVFSTQAAYAAPLILLAQNRQADRDRAEIERDRDTNARTLADTEFLAREIASIRLALSDVVTIDELKDTLAELKQTPDE